MKKITINSGTAGMAQVKNGQLHISDSKLFPVKFTGCANHINPPIEIFYGSKAIASEDFQVFTFCESYGNKVHEFGMRYIKEDSEGKKYFENTYKKGDTIIFSH